MNEVNQWVAKETHNQIPSLLNAPLDPGTKLLLLNAIYFQGNWLHPFNPRLTKPGVFHDGTKGGRNVQFMTQVGSFRILDTPRDYVYLELLYKDNQANMVILLPKTKTVEEVAKGLTVEQITADMNRLAKSQPQRVSVRLPKFKIEQAYLLKAALQRLGIRDAFTDAADLSLIGPGLKVDNIIHRATCVVDEIGTIAAAVTGGIVGTTAIESPIKLKVFNAEKPFLFVIRATANAYDLFFGRLSKP